MLRLLISANQLVALGLTLMTQRLRKNIVARQILGIAEGHGYQRKKQGKPGKNRSVKYVFFHLTGTGIKDSQI
jgi:hypothetical protein